MNQRFYQSMYHANINVILMEENVIHIENGIIINVDVSVKNIIFVKRDCIWRRTTSNSENGKYFTSIIYDSVITSSEVIEKTETVPTNFNEKKQPV